MQQWSITLHGPAGISPSVETGETQFVLGSEQADDVFTVSGEGIAARHAWIWISADGMQVEDLAGNTLVNGHAINERVQVEYPASVQVGQMVLVVETKAADHILAAPAPELMDDANPHSDATKNAPDFVDLDVTVVQKTPPIKSARKSRHPETMAPDDSVFNEPDSDAPLRGGYKLIREIARGGMGQIYFGEDAQLDREVAVKVSTISEGGEDPRFSKEAKVLAQLAHPNIVPIYNIGVDVHGRPFYSMKLIKGRTLQAVLNAIRDGDAETAKEYPRATLLTVFRKICDAMMFAHSKKILHRDLKPENIMVGEYGEVLVMDWGLAKVLGAREIPQSTHSAANDTGDYGVTMEGEVMGTPQYMSPEQAQGMVAELDVRSDIYSLGGILYATLTLRPPIDGKTLNEVLTKVKTGAITSMHAGSVTRTSQANTGKPAAMGAEIPEALQAVTMKAMATDRNKRYPNIEAFAADIEAYQNGFATKAEDAGALKQIVLLIKRNKVVSGLVALLFVSAVLFTVRLGASERMAVQERNTARRTAAEAHIILAESAEKDLDGESMQKYLQRVPEDLRTQPWEYMSKRLKSSSWEANMPGDELIRNIASHPKQPGVFLIETPDFKGLKSFTIATATFADFIKTEATPTRFVISGNGSRIAAWYRIKEQWRAIVHNCSDQSTAFDVHVPDLKELKQMSMSSDGRMLLLHYKSLKNESIARLVDTESQRVLWEQKAESYSMAEVMADGKVVWLMSPGSLREIDSATGNVLREKSGKGNSLAAFVAKPHRGYVIRFWANKAYSIHFEPAEELELRPDGKLLNPPSSSSTNLGLFFTLSSKSERCSVLQTWAPNSSKLHEVLCFGGAKGEWLLATDRTSDHIVIAKGSHLEGWRFGNPTPGKYKINVPAGAFAFLGNGSKIATIRTADESDKWFPTGFLETADTAQRKSAQEVQRPLGNTPMLPMITSSRDGGLLAAVEGSTNVARIHVFKNEGEKLIETAQWKPTEPAKRYQQFLLSPEGKKLLMDDRIVTPSSGTLVSTLTSRTAFKPADFSIWLDESRLAEIRSTAPELSSSQSPDEESSSQRLLVVWNTDTGEKIASAETPNAEVIAASPDGKWVAEAGLDNRVRVRDSKSLQLTTEFRAYERRLSDGGDMLGNPRSLVWHPQQPVLATVSTDGSLKLWEMPTGRLISEVRNLALGDRHPSRPVYIAFSPDGETALINLIGSNFIWHAYPFQFLRSGGK